MRQYVERAAFLSRFTIVWAKSQARCLATCAPAHVYLYVCMDVCGVAHTQVRTTLAPYDGGCLQPNIHTDI